MSTVVALSFVVCCCRRDQGRRGLSTAALGLLVLLCLGSRHEGAEAAKLRLCGKKLISVLQKICNHKYQTPSPERLSHAGHEYRARASGGGIADQCCVNRCSYRHLRGYCAVTTTAPPPLRTTATSLIQSVPTPPATLSTAATSVVGGRKLVAGQRRRFPKQHRPWRRRHRFSPIYFPLQAVVSYFRRVGHTLE